MFIFEDAPLKREEIQKQINHWKPENPRTDWLESMMYNHLAAIDGKTQSTMQASSTLLLFSAIFGFFKQSLPRTGAVSSYEAVNFIFTVGSVLAGLSFFISVFMCIIVVNLHWIPAQHRKEENDRQEFYFELVRIRNLRTRRYRIAWIFAMSGLSIVALTMAISVVYLLFSKLFSC